MSKWALTVALAAACVVPGECRAHGFLAHGQPAVAYYYYPAVVAYPAAYVVPVGCVPVPQPVAARAVPAPASAPVATPNRIVPQAVPTPAPPSAVPTLPSPGTASNPTGPTPGGSPAPTVPFPGAVPVPSPGQSPPPSFPGTTRPPQVNESHAYYDAYAMAREPSATPGERCTVAFWNLTDRDLPIAVDGQTRVVPRGRSVPVEAGRQFVWKIEGRDPQTEKVAAGETGLAIVIRR